MSHLRILVYDKGVLCSSITDSFFWMFLLSFPKKPSFFCEIAHSDLSSG